MSDTPAPAPTPEAAAAIDAAQRAEHCRAALRLVLLHYGCRLTVSQLSIDGQPQPPQIGVVPIEPA